ncbi:MAG: hypothetical protein K2X93_01180 [Candidatus Obscuribacterales bacterium]|nr:hypothetical protein [Candidatus Obscuribacterales bacterium]
MLMLLKLTEYLLSMIVLTILIVRRISVNSLKSPADFTRQSAHIFRRLRFWSGVASAALWSGIAWLAFGSAFAVLACCTGLYFGRLFFSMFVSEQISQAERQENQHEKPDE